MVRAGHWSHQVSMGSQGTDLGRGGIVDLPNYDEPLSNTPSMDDSREGRSLPEEQPITELAAKVVRVRTPSEEPDELLAAEGKRKDKEVAGNNALGATVGRHSLRATPSRKRSASPLHPQRSLRRSRPATARPDIHRDA